MSDVLRKIRKTKPAVISLLKQDKRCRDNDEILVGLFWWNELDKFISYKKVLTGLEFLTFYSQGKLTPADTITRARREIQEEMPELRGEKWEERHRKEKEVRTEIKNKE